MKTILVTGATDGIGKETAKLFAREGHSLLLHGRNAEKLESVKRELLELNESVRIETFVADLSVLAETRALAQAILVCGEGVDVIINNAGVFVVEPTITKDGLDVRFAVNALSPYLLTKILLPLLSEKGRIVNLSSAAQAPVDFQAMKSGGHLAADNAYAQSKLAITMWSMSLAEDLGERAVVVAVNPKSFLGSKMVKVAYGRNGFDLGIGADILYRAALSDEFANKTGAYYDNDYQRFASPHPFAQSKENRAHLIKVMDDIIAEKLEG